MAARRTQRSTLRSHGKIGDCEQSMNLVTQKAPSLKQVWIGLKWSSNNFYWYDHSVPVYTNGSKGTQWKSEWTMRAYVDGWALIPSSHKSSWLLEWHSMSRDLKRSKRHCLWKASLVDKPNEPKAASRHNCWGWYWLKKHQNTWTLAKGHFNTQLSSVKQFKTTWCRGNSGLTIKIIPWILELLFVIFSMESNEPRTFCYFD